MKRSSLFLCCLAGGLLSMCLVSGVYASVSQKTVEAKASLNQAAQAYNQGDYDTALALLEKAFELDPTLPQLKPYYGAALYAKYNLTGEEKYVRKALTIFQEIFQEEMSKSSPDERTLSNAASYIAVIYDNLGDKEKKREWMFKRLDLPGLTPQNKAEVYYGLGTSFWQDSFEITQRYMINRPPEPTYEVPEEEAAKVRELATRGLESIEQALALEPEYGDAWTYKNLLLRELAKIEIDPYVKRHLIEQADEARNRALEIIRRRQDQETQPRSGLAPPPPQSGEVSRTEIRRVSGGVLQGNAIRRVQPVYPAEARENGVSGSVEVEIIIDEDGNVISGNVISGPPELRRAALDAAQQWKFRPTLLQGQAIKVTGILIFNFRL